MIVTFPFPTDTKNFDVDIASCIGLTSLSFDVKARFHISVMIIVAISPSIIMLGSISMIVICEAGKKQKIEVNIQLDWVLVVLVTSRWDYNMPHQLRCDFFTSHLTSEPWAN